MRTVGILTLGCKVNTYESEYIIDQLKEHGYEIRDFDDICDVYIINTCTVTNTSDIKSRKMIRKAIRKNPDACVVAMGCFIEANKDFSIPGLDIVIGNRDKSKIIELLDEWFSKREDIRRLYQELPRKFEDMYINEFPGRTRAFVKIQDGCENFCSYCIIPYARGRETSGNHEKIVEQAIKLSKTSKELVLVGIHTGRYFDGEYHLYDLLKDLVKIDTLETIRLSSIEVTEITDEIIDLMASCDKLAHHLHIPLQSGSDEILKLMHRPYTMKEYKNRIAYIRKRIPDVSISCDLIVGFPNETDELFEETINNIKEIGFSFIHVFPYARKTGTVADKMEGHVPEIVKKERLYKVEEVQKEYTRRFNSSFVGKQLKMLVEKC